MPERDPRIKPSKQYEARIEEWRFQIASYESGAALMSKQYLFRHSRESASDFKNRLQRATPTGYARAVINSYKSLISRASVTRDTGNSELQEFIANDSDGRGTPLDQLVMERIFPINQACGMAWVLVDNTRPDQEPLSKADERDMGLDPYCVVYAPTQIINWAFDGFGNIEYVTVQLPPGKDPQTGKIEKDPRVKLWTPEGWELFDGRGKKIDEGFYGFGRVPFVVSYNERSIENPEMGASAIANIAYINREVFNLWSLLQDFMYRQCFNILALPADMMAQVDEETGEATVTLGNANAVPVSQGAFTPQYIAPPTDPAQFLISTIQQDIARIYDEAKLKGGDAAQVGQAQSGISKAFDFHDTNTLLAKKAKNLEDTEREIVDLWGEWKGMGEVDYNVQYAQTFDLTDSLDELEELDRFIRLSLNMPEFKRERVRRSVTKLMPDLDSEKADEIKAEVDALTFTQGQNQTPQQSPAVQNLAQRLGLAQPPEGNA